MILGKYEFNVGGAGRVTHGGRPEANQARGPTPPKRANVRESVRRELGNVEPFHRLG